jgi:hypothetical protein
MISILDSHDASHMRLNLRARCSPTKLVTPAHSTIPAEHQRHPQETQPGEDPVEGLPQLVLLLRQHVALHLNHPPFRIQHVNLLLQPLDVLPLISGVRLRLSHHRVPDRTSVLCAQFVNLRERLRQLVPELRVLLPELASLEPCLSEVRAEHIHRNLRPPSTVPHHGGALSVVRPPE